MKDAAARRKKRVPTRAIWIAAVGTAFLINGTVLGAVNGVDFGSNFAATDTVQVAPELVDLDTSCEGDVLLAASARAAMCLTPWHRDSAECASVDDLQMLMWMDMSACRSRDSALASVAMATIQPREIEKVTPIDAEQLIEELKQQQQPKPPPPPVPLLQPQQQPPPPPPAPAPPPPKRPQQVVETAKPNTDKEPDNARFLAEHNTMVEKQKVARGARNEPMIAKSKPEELKPKEKPPEEPPAIAKKPDAEPGKDMRAPQLPGMLSMRAPGAPSPTETKQDALKKGERADKQPLVANGGIPRRGDGAVEQQRRDPGELTKGQGGAGGGAPPVPNLKPSKEQLERIVGGGSVDHLEEVESGDETALNAKRWVYASFFNRLKRQVAQNWDPQTVWRRTDPQGSHHGFKTRVTEVRVVLTGKGDLSKVVVTAPSGVAELDEEAVRSFHAAAPFPNPPDGLVSKDGNITFAFSFFFEIGQSHTSWRVIKQ